MAETIKIEGLKELEQALMELPKATGTNVLRRALIAAAQPIQNQAQSLIRVKRITPAIVLSKIVFSAGDAGKRAFAEAMKAGATRAEAGEAAHAANVGAAGDANITSAVLSVGPTKRAFYGFEFGTVKQPPAPFMRPAWDANKMNALELIKETLKTEIDKAAARLARKAAKAASLIK